MPPRLSIQGACRALALRSRPFAQAQQPRVAALARSISDDTTATLSGPDGAVEDPFLVMMQQRTNRAPQKLPVAQSESEIEPEATYNSEILRQLEHASYGLNPFDVTIDGHKYGLPNLPIPKTMNMKRRYEPVVEQVTKLLMRDGKLSKAQRDMAMILNYLRTSPPPKLNPARPLLPGAPPPKHLPLNPVLYLTLAIDSVAPLVRIRNYKGLAGGGRALEIPIPLPIRQRRRMAVMWILDVVAKKPSKGSGRTMFPHRVAEEIVAVVEGRSSVWDKRHLLHKQGTSARANMNSPALRKR